MTHLEYQRELLAFDEKIALAEMEVSKATEQMNVLKYQKAKFNLEYASFAVKQEQSAVALRAQQQVPLAQPEVKA